MKHNILVSLILGASIIGCSAEEISYQTLVENGKENIINRLKDPESARFRELFISKSKDSNSTYLCGEVNAKNSLGGYTGFDRFAASTEKESKDIIIFDDYKYPEINEKYWNIACSNPLKATKE